MITIVLPVLSSPGIHCRHACNSDVTKVHMYILQCSQYVFHFVILTVIIALVYEAYIVIQLQNVTCLYLLVPL